MGLTPGGLGFPPITHKTKYIYHPIIIKGVTQEWAFFLCRVRKLGRRSVFGMSYGSFLALRVSQDGHIPIHVFRFFSMQVCVASMLNFGNQSIIRRVNSKINLLNSLREAPINLRVRGIRRIIRRPAYNENVYISAVRRL